MGTLHHLPPRYRVAWRNGEREGYVVDEASGKDWDTRQLDDAVSMMEQLRDQFPDFLFWIASGG